MRDLLSGALAAGTLVVALHFLKYWRQTADRLFGFFAVAFVLLAANAVGVGLTDPQGEFRAVVYGIRLVAFLVILYAIYDKNRSRDDPGTGHGKSHPR
jgi:hypothetical protein